MQAEKAQYAKEKQIHKLRGKIERRERFSVMGISVRMVGDKARRHARMALATGGH